MKSYLFILLIASTLIASCNTSNTDQKNTTPLAENMNKDKNKFLRHVVLFNFNDDATSDIVSKIEQEFVKLSEKISAIHDIEWGTNNSPEGLDKGLTHCFLVTFKSEADREVYLPHPEHQNFVKFIGPYVEDVTVIDYWVE